VCRKSTWSPDIPEIVDAMLATATSVAVLLPFSAHKLVASVRTRIHNTP
jgi:acyl-coenzyme A synthetase/AMP-(fatty) acid ligase